MAWPPGACISVAGAFAGKGFPVESVWAMKESNAYKGSGSRFPLRLFFVFLFFYSGEAIYNTYINLYMSGLRYSNTQIGLIISVSTVCSLLSQMVWGVVSDRVGKRKNVLELLFVGTALVALMFYLSTDYIALMILVSLFSFFFSPLIPLLDNYLLEFVEGTKWNYGQIRLGGTIGYCATVLTIGFFLGGEYGQIFWMVAATMLLGFMISSTLQDSAGRRMEEEDRKEKTARASAYRVLAENRELVVLIAYNIAFQFGVSLFYNFYPIYYVGLGGKETFIGVIMFVAAISDVPVFLFAGKLIQRFGYIRIMIGAGAITCIRWVLLAAFHHPVLVIAVTFLHGMGFSTSAYCIAVYINDHIPEQYHATAQSVKSVFGTVVSRVILGVIGGALSDVLGMQFVLLVAAGVMAVSTAAFTLWGKRLERRRLC